MKTLIRIWAPGIRALRILLHHNIGRTNQASLDGCDALHQMLKLCTGDQWDAGSPALNKELKVSLSASQASQICRCGSGSGQSAYDSVVVGS